jgi:serine protease Do
VRGDKEIIELCNEFVLLRFTQMRGVNLALFDYDYDMTWMSFFLDADGRVYSRYGSRDSNSADSHNSAAGLLNTMRKVLALHKEESAKPRPPEVVLRSTLPSDIPAYRKLYGNTCGRCHMLNEAKWEQQRLDGTMKQGPFFLYPVPDNIGIKLDIIKGNVIKEIVKGSFADKGGLKPSDTIRTANGKRVLTIADLQYVLNKLDSESKLTVAAERDGKPVTAVLELSGNWRASDVSWRKSIRVRSRFNDFTRPLVPVPAEEKQRLGIKQGDLAYRLTESKGEVKEAGLLQGDIVVALDGKRQLPYRNPQYYPLIEHRNGDTMQVTILRDGKERTLPLRIP